MSAHSKEESSSSEQQSQVQQARAYSLGFLNIGKLQMEEDIENGVYTKDAKMRVFGSFNREEPLICLACMSDGRIRRAISVCNFEYKGKIIGCGRTFCAQHGHPHFIGESNLKSKNAPLSIEDQLMNLQLVQECMNLKRPEDIKLMRFCNDCDPRFMRIFKKQKSSITALLLGCATIVLFLCLIYLLLKNILESVQYQCPEGFWFNRGERLCHKILDCTVEENKGNVACQCPNYHYWDGKVCQQGRCTSGFIKLDGSCGSWKGETQDSKCSPYSYFNNQLKQCAEPACSSN